MNLNVLVIYVVYHVDNVFDWMKPKLMDVMVDDVKFLLKMELYHHLEYMILVVAVLNLLFALEK
jgi:hypothetical protein